MQQLEMTLQPREVGAAMAAMATEHAERHVTEGFTLLARDFVLRYLTEHGNSAGEDIVDAGIAKGIKGKDGRAWGSVFANMNGKQILCIRSDLPRRHGRGTSGGRLWGLMR